MKIYRAPFPPDSASMKVLLRPVADRVCRGRGWNNQCRGRLFGTAGASHVSKGDGHQRRVSLKERKAMVESYVSKYRVKNAGKFPTVTDAQREVGGGYYTIRKIVQELEYNSKLMSEGHSKDTLLRGTVEENHISGGKLTSERTGVSLPSYVNDENVDMVYSTDQLDSHAKFQESLSEPGEVTGTSAEDLGGSQTIVEPEVLGAKLIHDQSSPDQVTAEDHADSQWVPESQPLDTKSGHGESSSNQVAAQGLADSQTMVKHDVSDVKSIHGQISSYADGSPRDSSVQNSDDTKPQKKSSLWGNLKSLADNLISLWTKR